jgi:hypothetical protein
MNNQSKFPFKFTKFRMQITSLCSLLFYATLQISAQMPQVRVPPAQQPTEDNTWWYVTLFVLVISLVGAVFWMLKAKKEEKESKTKISKKEKMMSEDNSWDANSVDADKEMEWFRRHKKTVGKSVQKPKKKNLAEDLPKTSKIFNRNVSSEETALKFSDKEFKEKLQTLQFNQLPIFKFQKLELARPFAPLSISNDDALMSAIEQTHDEYEEDEEIRDLAVRILQRFRTRNSVEALTQVALYDLSSNVRSKAVTILADFNRFLKRFCFVVPIRPAKSARRRRADCFD